MSHDLVGVRRALLSVSNKHGLEQLGRALARLGVELLSTGGTAAALRGYGLNVTDVAEVTGYPEMMDGRVKTLHPAIHGGLLGRRGVDDAVMQAQGIRPIDLLVVNLYPFRQTLEKPGVSFEECVENMDVGGPAMLRAAAKNHAAVAVLTDPADYQSLIDSLDAQGGTTLRQRRRLAAQAFAHTAEYDGRIAEFLGARIDPEVEPFPPTLHLNFIRADVLRYGENPHQRGALYLEHPQPSATVGGSRMLQGKALSFNNLADADAALECVKQFDEPACVIVKHANPCGVAVAPDLQQAYDRAYATDPISAFGGIIAFNRPLDGDTARSVVARQFVEVVIAPEINELALAAFAAKPNVRVLACGPLSRNAAAALDYQRIHGGLLVQDADRDQIRAAELKVVTQRAPLSAEFSDLVFAWKVAMYVKSNAIVYAHERRTIGIGAGQMSRVVSARIAALKAEEVRLNVAGSVMASDAFFPFRDGIDAAAKAGIRAVIQPGGSMRDEEVIRAADEAGMAMVFTGIRHFRH